MPGSPFFQAMFTMVSKTWRALKALDHGLARAGETRSYSSSFSTASMKVSVMATEMLKLFSRSFCCLQVMKSRMSGWSTERMPMFAPRRVPPCFTVSVAASNTVMNEMGPDETPLVDFTTSFFGRMREKEKPVPPPDLWMSAACFTDSKISSMESPTGSTKQAESWPSSRPAFMSVGLFGRNSREVMRR